MIVEFGDWVISFQVILQKCFFDRFNDPARAPLLSSDT